MDVAALVAIALIAGIAIPVVAVAIPLLIGRIPERVIELIGDIALFMLVILLAALLFVLGLGGWFNPRKEWRDLRRSHAQ